MIPRKIFALALFFLSFPFLDAFAVSFDISNSLQAGFEYDSNVYKTYNTSVKDVLFRGLLKTNFIFKWPSYDLDFSYRLGGKKYFTEGAQDTLINFFELNFSKTFTSSFAAFFTSNAKVQSEASSIDKSGNDINEDFNEIHEILNLRIKIPWNVTVLPHAEFSILDFNSEYPTINYWHQRYGTTFLKSLGGGFETTMAYHYSRYNFMNIQRIDNLHETGFQLKFTKTVIAQLGYTFQTNDSSAPGLSFKNHKISILSTLPVRFKRKNGNNGSLNPDLALSLIVILQIKNYPGLFDVDAEGRRFLLSESEDDNFNVIVAKITKSLGKSWTAEFKFTRHSNEFASTGQNYARSTYYTGVRFEF
jgi:hypothetical protein